MLNIEFKVRPKYRELEHSLQTKIPKQATR